MSAEPNYQKYEPIFGDWTVNKKLGQGSVGHVYEIEKEQNGETVRSALKFICIPEDEDEIKRVLSTGIREKDLPQYYSRVMEDFLQEFRCMRQMKECSSIVRYEEHLIRQHEDGIGWDILMRMELLTPLMEYALDHEMTEDDVIALGLDLSEALIACEKLGILHRDIKPDNIFVDENGRFKLGDFGVAKIIEETQMNLSHKGTIAYMAPEIYRGEAYNKTADIYSIGLVLYKYLNNGRLPFMPSYPEAVDYDDSEKALVRRVRKEDIPAPANGSDALKKIVVKACSADVKMRYQSPEELEAALQSIKEHESAADNIAANTDDSADDTHYAGKKRKSLITALAAVLVMIIFVTSAVWAFTPKEVTDITGINDEVTMYIGDSMAPEYIIEPDRFKDEQITFEADDTSVLHVDDKGELKAESVGETSLSLKAKEYEKKVEVTVIPKVTEIIGLKNIEITEGESTEIQPVLKPDKFKNEKVTFTSKDENVASVTKSGKVKALKEGTSTITISAGGCEKKIKVTVNAKPVVVTQQQTSSSTYSGSYQKPQTNNSGSKKSSVTKKSNKKSKKSKGYFDSSKDEYFG